jgi:hypothetical protein
MEDQFLRGRVSAIECVLRIFIEHSPELAEIMADHLDRMEAYAGGEPVSEESRAGIAGARLNLGLGAFLGGAAPSPPTDRTGN